MQLICPNDILAEALLRNNGLIAVVERLGIPLGMGNDTLSEACARHKIDAEFCAALLNTLSEERYYPELPLSAQNALHLVGYLRQTHEHYRHAQLRMVQAHVKRLVASSVNPNKMLQGVEQAWEELHDELLRYFAELEERLFTHVLFLHSCCMSQAAGQALPHDAEVPVNFAGLQQRFQSVVGKVREINTLLVKYLGGDFDRGLRNAVILHLSGVERDLRGHLGLQERLLLPAMLNMRSSLTNKKLEEIYRYTSQTLDLPDGKELSERERQVLTLVAKGLSSNSIAKRLSISLHTVQAHRKNIAAKLGIKTVSGLTTYAIMHGLVNP